MLGVDETWKKEIVVNWHFVVHFKIGEFLGYLKDISVQFSHSVVSDSLRPHELQHARPSCPSPTPGVHPYTQISYIFEISCLSVARYSISREFPRSVLKCETVLGTLDATSKVP